MTLKNQGAFSCKMLSKKAHSATYIQFSKTIREVRNSERCIQIKC